MRSDLEWKTWSEKKGDLSVVESFEESCGYKLPGSFKLISSKYDGACLDENIVFKFFSNLLKKEDTRNVKFFYFVDDEEISEKIQWNFINKPDFFPKKMLAFGRDGGGNLLCFDYRNAPFSDNPPVVFFHQEGSPDTEEQLSFIAESFDDFLKMLYDEDA